MREHGDQMFDAPLQGGYGYKPDGIICVRIGNQRGREGMLANTECLRTRARRYWRPSAWAAAIGTALLFLGSAAWAQDQSSSDLNVPALRLIKTIPIFGTAASPKTLMFSFDISFVDPANGLYYLADRSNRAIDIIDTTGTNTGICGSTDTGPDTLCGQVGGPAVGFVGFTGNNDTSGPDGVLATFPCVFAGDGNSRVVAFNWGMGVTNVAGTLSTGGTTRVDEMAYDPTDGILIVTNPGESPPFVTLITISKPTCAMSNPIKVSLGTLPTATNYSPAVQNPKPTNGAEQPVWEPVTKRFYQPIPEVNGPGGGGPNGGIAQINPVTGKIENFFQINFCQPSGSAAGPNGDLLLQCSTAFDLTGKACVTAAPSPAGQPATIRLAECTGTSGVQVVICNPGRGCTPSNGSIVSVPGAGAGDEVWFNPGSATAPDNKYYIAQQSNPVGASLAVVASGATSTPNTLLQIVPTLPPQGARVPTTPSGALAAVAPSAHSVAASAANNHVYVPLQANNAYPNCWQGCVAVFSAQ
jgi:hypothetical protein